MKSPTKSSQMEWLRAPQQGRSQRSLQRILDTTERILEKKRFAEVSVSEIARQAHSSVGVFYARFPDKLALLHLLDDRFTAEAEETVNRQLDFRKWQTHHLGEVSEEIIGLLCRIHREKKGMMRSIVLQARVSPDPNFQANGKRLSQLIGRIADFLCSWKGEISHPQPERAVRLALVMVIATIKETILFDETTMLKGQLGLGDHAFPAALHESFLRCIGASMPERGRLARPLP